MDSKIKSESIEPVPEKATKRGPVQCRAELLQALMDNGDMNNHQLRTATGITGNTLKTHLGAIQDLGLVTMDAVPHSPSTQTHIYRHTRVAGRVLNQLKIALEMIGLKITDV